MRIALVELLSQRVISYSLGVGILYHRLSRFFARLAFSYMERVSVRDPETMETLQRELSKDIEDGIQTGMRPFLKDGVLKFLQIWSVFIGTKIAREQRA